jgi:hypothetical protein
LTFSLADWLGGIGVIDRALLSVIRRWHFRVLGGVPQRGIFDNMKTAVDKIGSGKARQVNARFAAMASHYLFEPKFCNPAAGWEEPKACPQDRTARLRRTCRMRGADCGSLCPAFRTWRR